MVYQTIRADWDRPGQTRTDENRPGQQSKTNWLNIYKMLRTEFRTPSTDPSFYTNNIFINGEKKHKCEEDAKSSKEMPDVVKVVEVEEEARLVEMTRLCRG